jgi:hypothetical protein
VTETFSQDRPQLPKDEVKSKTKESQEPIFVGDEMTMDGEME